MTNITFTSVLFFVSILFCVSEDDTRIWKDSTGKFSVEAELLSYGDRDGTVVLKAESGKEIKIALDRLSQEDQLYVRERQREALNVKSAVAEPASSTTKKPTAKALSPDIAKLKEIATQFYSDLGTKDRMVSRSMLTEVGKQLAEENKSALAFLPKPDAGKYALKVGKPKIAGEQATIPVIVRMEGVAQNTSLHLRKIDEEWRIFGMSAKMGDEENTIDFEASVGASKKPESPLAKLKDQPISIAGLTLAGAPVSLDMYKGKVVLIDFWATWCGPCRAEIPNILANYQKYHAAGFEVMAVSVDDDLNELMSFVKDENPPWVVLADKHPRNSMSMAKKFGISGIPAFILVGRDGKVIDINCRGPKLGMILDQVFANSP